MLKHLDILQVYNQSRCTPAARAVRFAAGLASQMGARNFVADAPPKGLANGFYALDETQIATDDIGTWTANADNGHQRIALQCVAPGERKQSNSPTVFIELEDWQTEETLFARSGLAYLLGDPEKRPLVPHANYAAHTVGYAVFAALISLATKLDRFGETDNAIVNAEGVLAWINWKSAVAASLGADSKRQGAKAEWPVLECRDGYAAFVFNERDWPQVCEMVGDPQLKAEQFSSFEDRQANREGYMKPIREWFLSKSKTELTQSFLDRSVPGAVACTIPDLLNDPLLRHRKTFYTRSDSVSVPQPAYRIAAEAPARISPQPRPTLTPSLPLSGLRVLDFGIITAGAGVSALLADLGADVIKVESKERFDPFRIWPGGPKGMESPVFKSNNRNKRAIALDLKSEDGVSTFLELAKSADIVIENYRRGVLDRLGLTFEALRDANPNILLASISSQGLEGPGAEHTTFGSTLEASSGFAAVTHYEDGRPVISGRNLNYPDQIVCLYAAAMITATVHDCKEMGVARHLDISQRDCAIYQLGDAIADASVNQPDHNAPDSAVSRPSVSTIVRCADGEFAALSAYDTETRQSIPGLSDHGSDHVSKWASQITAQEAVLAFLNAGGGGTIVRNGKNILEDDGYARSEIFTHSPNGTLVKGFPFQFVSSPMVIARDSPAIGEHTEEVLNQIHENSTTK